MEHEWCDNLGEGWCARCGASSPWLEGEPPLDYDFCPGGYEDQPAPPPMTREEFEALLAKDGLTL